MRSRRLFQPVGRVGLASDWLALTRPAGRYAKAERDTGFIELGRYLCYERGWTGGWRT